MINATCKKLLLGFISISIGGIIYIIWRGQELLMFSWFDIIGLKTLTDFIRKTGSVFPTPPNWFIYSLPNALWLIGGFLLFHSVWNKHIMERIVWTAFFSLIAFGSEIAQLIGFLPGVYDKVDLIFMIIPIMIFIFIEYNCFVKEVNNEKSS